MNWLPLESISALENIDEISMQQYVAIFKHSTTCSISSMSKQRLERKWTDNITVKIWYLDLLRYRDISNAIAQKYNVQHESPQILLIRNKKCIYHASHLEITVNDLLENIK